MWFTSLSFPPCSNDSEIVVLCLFFCSFWCGLCCCFVLFFGAEEIFPQYSIAQYILCPPLVCLAELLRPC